MGGNRKYLPTSQLYDTKYSTVQYYNKSLEDLYESLKEKKLANKKQRRELKKIHENEFGTRRGILQKIICKIWMQTFGQFGEDWLFLAILGIAVAILSYTIDQGVAVCYKAKLLLYSEIGTNYFTKWLGWVILPTILVLWNVGITHLIAPKAVGSGVPQIKTCLRGIYLKEFLSMRVLLAKWIGITATLGSGLPLGKEGPLIQMSSILVTKMSKFLSNFKSIYLNENKKIELIGAAYAVGVASTFNSPIGGVLFSVEISMAYYAVRNYWRGFFAAVWAATIYRLLYVWIDGADTIRVVFETNFKNDFPYDTTELISFAVLGVICGFGGSFYIFCTSKFMQWSNNNKLLKRIKETNRFIYPFFIIVLISSVTCPIGFGQFIAADQSSKDQVVQLFSNFTWSQSNHSVVENRILNHWTTDYTGIYANLVAYFWYQFIASILAASLPIPNGAFIPNFRAGAALGRITGELMATWFPQGVHYKGKVAYVIPGAYATVGAASFSGAVTHTLSTSVILFEMTSQITHVIPVLISNLIANGIARIFTPSIYDLVIKAQKLPYLPDLLPSSSTIYQIFVEDFMIKDVKYIYLGMTYNDLKTTLKQNKNIKVFPLVDNLHNMILLGSVSRNELVKLMEYQIGYKKRLEIVECEINNDKPDNDNYNKQERIQMIKDRIFDKYNTSKINRSIKHTEIKEVVKHKLSIKRICDLPMETQQLWEENQLKQDVNFTLCHIDPAPFQLVERTSLLKVHSLFSLLSINTVYVTTIGKLIGVVGLKELRQAIEDANSGEIFNNRREDGAGNDENENGKTDEEFLLIESA